MRQKERYSLDTGVLTGNLDLRFAEIMAKEESMHATANPAPPTEFEELLKIEMSDLYNLLTRKNRKYGNSAMEPLRIFSRQDSIEQIKVRIDDKLSRIANNDGFEDEDVVIDLMGYLMILKMSMRKDNIIKKRKSYEESTRRNDA